MKEYLEQCGLNVGEHYNYSTISEYQFRYGDIIGEMIVDRSTDSYRIHLQGQDVKYFDEWPGASDYLTSIVEEAEHVDIASVARRLSSGTLHFLKTILARYRKTKKDRYTAKELFQLGSYKFVKSSVRELFASEFIYLTGVKPKLVYNFDRSKLDSLL
jgi:hypothetical protein